MFDSITIDPETGDLLEYNVTPEMQEQLDAKFKDASQFAAALMQQNGETFKQMQEETKKTLEPALKAAAAAAKWTKEFMQETEQLRATIKNIRDTILTDETRELLRNMRDIMQPLQEMFNELETLEPYLRAELSKPEYEGQTLDHILKTYTPGELLELLQDHDSFIYKAWEAAKAAKAAEPIDIETYRADKLNTPVDRVNFLAWNNFKETGGQIKFDMRSEKDKNDPERRDLSIAMRYSLSFGDNPNIKTTKELNHYDRRLTQAIDTLMTAGKDIMLPSEIFYGMGGTGRMGDTQLKNINASLTKQGTGRVYINNKEEAAHYDYPEIVYDGNILNFERIVVRYKGQEREAIKLLRRPVLMEFADQRDQLSAVPMKALQSPISKTDNHLRIEDYLLHRIVRQKKIINDLQEKQQKKYTQKRQKEIREARTLTILLETFYENTGNLKKKAVVRQRALDTAKRYLSHYQSEAGGYYINSYSIKDDRIIIELPIKK